MKLIYQTRIKLCNMNICIDFDGTCVTHEFPLVGKDIGAVPVLKKLVKAGHNLILFTMRSSLRSAKTKENSLGWNNPKEFTLKSDVLQDAVDWFKKNKIPLYGINTNPDQNKWTASPKAYGHLYIDDAALGCPTILDLTISLRPFVNWESVEKTLIKLNFL